MTDLNLLILMDDCLKRITGSMKLHFTSLMLKIGSTSKDGSCFDAMLSIDTTSSFTDLTGAVGVGFELFAAGFEVSMALEGGANMERRLVDGDSDLTLCKGLVDRIEVARTDTGRSKIVCSAWEACKKAKIPMKSQTLPCLILRLHSTSVRILSRMTTPVFAVALIVIFEWASRVKDSPH